MLRGRGTKRREKEWSRRLEVLSCIYASMALLSRDSSGRRPRSEGDVLPDGLHTLILGIRSRVGTQL